MNNKTLVIILAIVVVLPVGYYFGYALPQHNKALQELELQKLEYQKEQVRKEEARQEEERKAEEEKIRQEMERQEMERQEMKRQEMERQEKFDKDTDGYIKCKNAATTELNMMLNAKVGCDPNFDGPEGSCKFSVNSTNADIVKKIMDDNKNAIEKCKQQYPNADFYLID